MASRTRKPVNILQTVNMTQSPSSSTVPQGAIKLSDETKRISAVAIALNNVLLPDLRKLIDVKLKELHSHLVKKWAVNTLQNSLYDPKTLYGFEYRDPRSKDPKKFVIKTHHDLAKLYLKPYMTHFQNISDDSFDASAALNILIFAKCDSVCSSSQPNSKSCICFTDEQRKLAVDIRDNVRNEWAHWSISSWTATKYLEAFHLMEKMANQLPSASTFDRVTLVQNLDTWKLNGLKLLGNNVDESLIKNMLIQCQKMVLNIDNLEQETKQRLQEMTDEFETVMGELEGRQKKLEDDQTLMNGVILDNSQRITNLEDKLEDTSSSPLFSIPVRNLHFTGREDFLQEIGENLNERGNPIVTIQGLGGVGKTSLAVEAARRAEDNKCFPGGIYWLTADSDSESGDRVLLNSISKVLGKNPCDQPDAKKLDMLTSHLMKQDKCLLVIDNVDSEEFSDLVYTLINGMWVNKSQVSMLVTSRLKEKLLTSTSNISRPSKNYNLQSFNTKEGMDFLRKKTQLQEKEIVAQGGELVSEVGGLPLALDQAVGFLNLRTGCRLSDYINKLKKEKMKNLNKAPAPRATEDVERARLMVKTTWRMNLELIQRDFPEALDLMHILAFLSPSCIPMIAINEGCPRLGDDLATLLEDNVDKQDLIHQMTKLSLFEEASADTVRVHRLVQDILKDDVRKSQQTETVLTAAQSMLVFALDKEVDPSFILETDVMINWKEASLRNWALILENVGHFIVELKREKVQTNKASLCMLYDHTVLYYKILNQMDQSAKVRDEMIELMKTFKGQEKYYPKFPDVIKFKVKEVLCQLMDPMSVLEREKVEGGGEYRVIESRDEGDFYLQADKCQLAVQAYQRALDNNPTADLKQDIQQNMCEAFYKMDNPTRCIDQAHHILSDFPEDSSAHYWIALSHKKEAERENGEHGQFLRTELSSIYGVLSWSLSCHDPATAQALANGGILYSNDLVTQVSSSWDLEKALEASQSLLYKRSGVRNVLVLKHGEYRIPPSFWMVIHNICLIGETAAGNQKPIILLDEPTPPISSRNIFINIHFKIDAGHLTVGSHNDTCLFLDCTFVSNSPNLSAKDVDSEKKRWEKLVKVQKDLRDLSVEELEQRKLTEEEKYAEKEHHLKELKGNPHPAIVVERGVCVMVQCEMLDCLGAGALVLWPDEQTGIVTPPWLYMRACVMRNCGFAGAEAREEGNLVLDNCTISDCNQGVLVWRGANYVTVKRSSIYNSTTEGVLVIDPSENYNNDMRVVFEENYIHHNQIGISLSHARSVDIRRNLIFSNRSWGIFLRNSNVSTIQSNNIFRNACGGIRICLNRFDRTYVMKNHIHDHTGPGLCQTTFFSESGNHQVQLLQTKLSRWYADGRISDENMERILYPTPLDRGTNSVPVFEMDNTYENNELEYGSTTEKKPPVEKDCSFCSKPRAAKPCNSCRKVWYCGDECLKQHFEEHKALFCDFFSRTKIINVTLTPADISPSNELIANYIKEGKKKKLRDYKDREFLVKITAGVEYFGLDEAMANQQATCKGDEEPEGRALYVYDKLRFVCGVVKNVELRQFVREFGKLCGEKIYSKRIFLFAKISGSSKNHLELRTDEMQHELGW